MNNDGLTLNQLAEANHPETGDWLYDDPIELAKAIRKGPDMPPVQPVADSEPDRNPVLAYADSYRDMAKQGVESVPIWSVITDLERNIAPLYRHAQPAPVVQCPFPCGWDNLNKLAIQDAALVARGLVEGELTTEAHRQAAISNNDRLLKVISACRAAMLHAGNSPAQSDCCPAQNCIHSAQGIDRPVAWHHTAKSKEENHSTCCFSYAPSHDFGPRYEKPQSQPHYLPERLDYDRALHFLSTEPRKVTPETVIGGNSPVIPDGWTCNDKANAALMMLDRIETADPVDDDRIDGIKRIVCELAAAPHDTPALNSVQSVDSVADRWIPVSERMPDENAEQQVLACFKGGDISTLYYFEGRWDDAYGIVPIRQDVTHWMPLPAAPQEPKP
ncbi:DUF551 domain-containing protein [Klebsiella pneumoniae subsp. ozaenae]